MNFCSKCGAPVQLEIPAGDDRLRHVCHTCGAIHYHNPKVVTGCIPYWQDQVLLCRRAIEPRKGLWTLPAGFMENGESTQQGAARETLEEANARVKVGRLYTVFSLPAISQVYMLYLAELEDLQFSAGAETLEVALFGQSQIPWQELAFQVVRETLGFYFADRQSGHFGLRSGTIEHLSEGPRGYRVVMHDD